MTNQPVLTEEDDKKSISHKDSLNFTFESLS